MKPPERPEWTRESERLCRRMLRLERPGERAKELYGCSRRGVGVGVRGDEAAEGLEVWGWRGGETEAA